MIVRVQGVNLPHTHPEMDLALPYAMEYDGQDTTYQITTANFHHLFVEILVAQWSGPTQKYHQWRSSLGQRPPTLTPRLRQYARQLRQHRVLDYDEDLSVMTPLDRCRRAEDPLRTAWGVWSFLTYLVTGVAWAPAPYWAQFRQSTMPPYHEWYSDPTHNMRSWQSFCRPFVPLNLKPISCLRSHTIMMSYLRRLNAWGMHVPVRSRLVRQCHHPTRLDNATRGQVICHCQFPCTTQAVWQPSPRGGRIHVPRALQSRWRRIHRHLGVVQAQVLRTPQGELPLSQSQEGWTIG